MSSPYTSKTTASELATDFTASITGKIILVTGVSPGGLGAAFVTAIAKASPSLLILAGRSITKTSETASTLQKLYPNVQTRILELDLGSLASVHRAAEKVNSWTDVPAIDVLVNNAGIMAVEYGLSPEGTESHFAMNHLGHFLLTNLVMGKIRRSEAPRVVNVSSDGHRLSAVRFDDVNFDVRIYLPVIGAERMDGKFTNFVQGGKTYNKWVAYGQSKTANMLFAVSLAEKLGKTGLLAFSLHPGVIATNLSGHLDWEGDFGSLSMLFFFLSSLRFQNRRAPC
jgi:NAD(P)-dependent dehydrogenase (short-subunit alcohol dehydrogenase family)